MNIIESILKECPCYRAGRTIVPKGLMLHSVGVGQPSASVFVRRFGASNYTSACVHAFIDAENGNVYQTLPWNHRAWHCGGDGNNTHIGVEMCESAFIRYNGASASFTILNQDKAKEDALRAYQSAVELFAFLCKKYNLNPLGKNVIISHNEGGRIGIASGHIDPEHLWKGLGMSLTMDNFRKDVARAMEVEVAEPTPTTKELYRVRKKWSDAPSQIGAFSLLENAVAMAKKNEGYCVYNSKGKKMYPAELAVGDKVKVLKAETYEGKQFKLYFESYEIMSVNKDRVVIGVDGVVVAAVHKDNIQKL